MPVVQLAALFQLRLLLPSQLMLAACAAGADQQREARTQRPDVPESQGGALMPRLRDLHGPVPRHRRSACRPARRTSSATWTGKRGTQRSGAPRWSVAESGSGHRARSAGASRRKGMPGSDSGERRKPRSQAAATAFRNQAGTSIDGGATRGVAPSHSTASPTQASTASLRRRLPSRHARPGEVRRQRLQQHRHVTQPQRAPGAVVQLVQTDQPQMVLRVEHPNRTRTP